MSPLNLPSTNPNSGQHQASQHQASQLQSAKTAAQAANLATNQPDALGAVSPLQRTDSSTTDKEPIREAFGDFVGQTLFGNMLASMRESVGTPAYFHGGRTEEVFQEQLDQHLVEEISDASSESIVDPMFELFQLQRRA